MANEDREVLFSNERFLIGVLQVVSGGALVAAVAQKAAFTDLAGKMGYAFFVTAMIAGLGAAILAAYWKHSYKMWDVKAGASEAQARFAKSVNDDNGFGVHSREVTERHKRANRDLRLMRGAMKAAMVTLLVGFVALLLALWIDVAFSPAPKEKPAATAPPIEEKTAKPPAAEEKKAR